MIALNPEKFQVWIIDALVWILGMFVPFATNPSFFTLIKFLIIFLTKYEK